MHSGFSSICMEQPSMVMLRPTCLDAVSRAVEGGLAAPGPRRVFSQEESHRISRTTFPRRADISACDPPSACIHRHLRQMPCLLKPARRAGPARGDGLTRLAWPWGARTHAAAERTPWSTASSITSDPGSARTNWAPVPGVPGCPQDSLRASDSLIATG